MNQSRQTLRRLAVSLVALALAAGTGSAWAGSCSASASPDIVATATEAGTFNTLLTAAKAAGLVDALRADGPLTVFAPTDEAFARLPKGTLESLLEPRNKDMLASILTYHVAPGSLTAGRVVKLDRIKTLNGQRPVVSVERGTVKIGPATVTQADIMASNGVIHVIDTVLLPEDKDIIDTALAAGNFKTLAAALDAAGLVPALQGVGPFTVFAPTDEAFAKLPSGTVESLLDPANRDRLTAILTYHVVPGDIYSSDARPGRLETLQGSEVEVSTRRGELMIDQARVIATDVVTSNGVIHVIDEVVLPVTERASSTEAAEELIRLAIDRGVPLFNRGQAEACTAIYEVAAQGLMSSDDFGLSDHDRNTLRHAMTAAQRTHDAGRQAWILRDALDDVMRSVRKQDARGEMAISRR